MNNTQICHVGVGLYFAQPVINKGFCLKLWNFGYMPLMFKHVHKTAHKNACLKFIRKLVNSVEWFIVVIERIIKLCIYV